MREQFDSNRFSIFSYHRQCSDRKPVGFKAKKMAQTEPKLSQNSDKTRPK